MPPKWPRQPTREDPEYRRLDDRMNFAVHVALFAACNSGLLFFHQLHVTNWAWGKWITLVWSIILLIHLIYIFGIVDYSTKSNG
ncbi:MAG: 2TM domain-containing protein [Oscillatoria sp. PMC 1051.18]|uniref:2TM domain-containing protein n=1 Tax=Oscillatoria salina TaxID=331517 RepID=UPI0013BD6DB0|nr:2TM domain-containing protein [Oscillatoria salina]MBZ8179973.1 Pr2TM family membrane protein [Oscillatoria salina IIICB1]MEC4895863.1 2TM domain-containing protein [Oscillatoria sp. PMC 1050.18]MEC5032719.1 2TM domain-containing protein [Oscillatoria sp. PMC 1051.18]NET86802.1 Pr2TM family membrane protein [Kamptonema sp. SIO1D9]